jgi:hypothetical protein
MPFNLRVTTNLRFSYNNVVIWIDKMRIVDSKNLMKVLSLRYFFWNYEQSVLNIWFV